MKRKKYFLRVFALLALLLPWSLQAQNAKVSEYDGTAGTATYTSIAGTSGAQAWSQGDYVDVTMPFAMPFGESQIASGSTLRVFPDGSASFTSLEGSRIAPLYYSSGYTTTATSIYTKSSAQQLTVEWRKVVSGQNSYSFQLKLYPGGDIEFCYGPMTISGSISVLVGMMSSENDIYRVGGANGTNDWSDITRYTSGTTTRTLSTSYHPAYDAATGTGMVYSFTQPACVKPTSVTATALAWNSIQVDWSVSSAGTGFEVKYSADPSFDPNTEGASKTVSNGSATSTTISVAYGGTTYYIYVRKMCNGTPSGWSPMATATTLPGCYSANLPSVTLAGVVSWTSPDDMVTSYDVKYGLSGFNPETEGTTVSNIAGLTTTLPVASLTPATAYDVYLRTHCSSSNVTTDWVGPVSFNTPCGAISVGPNNFYTQNFEGTSMPMCWSEDVVAGSSTWSYSDGYVSFPYTDGDVSRLVTPIFNFGAGDYQVDFFHAECNYGDYQDSLLVYYRTSPTGEWVLLQAFGNAADHNNLTLSKATILLPNTNSTYQLAFEGQGHDGYNVYLSNVVVRTQPTCPAPTGIAATSEGVVSWTAGTNNTSYDLIYGLAGFTSVEEGTVVENITGTTFTLAGIEGSTSYDVYVRAHCSATNEISEGWVGPASFTTPCAAIAVTATNPFVEGFEGTTIPSCWSLEYVSGTHDWVFNSYGDYSTTTGTHSGSHNALFKHTSTGTVTKLVSPVLNLANGSYALNFWHIQRSWGGDIDNMKIYYRTSPSGDWTLLQSYTGAIASWTQDEIALVNTNATYQIAFEATDNYGYGVGLDDVTITKLADCLNPVGLAVSGVTASEATLTWIPRGTATQWEVKLGTPGFDPSEEGSAIMVNTNPTLALAYLEANTNYEAYVRAICDPEGPTEWSNSVSFSTSRYPCISYGNPSAEEAVTIGNGTTDLNYVPAYTTYDYSYSQQIYTADEIGGAGIINSIAFEISGVKSRQVDIYLVETDKSSFASSTDWVAVTDADKVFTGTIGNATGWETYTLTTPFNYSGTGNLVVVVDNNNGSWSSGLKAKGGAGYTNMALYKYQDNNNIDPANPPSGTRYSSRNNLRLGIQYAPCITGICYPPQVAIALSETEYAATLTFTNANEDETNPSYGIIYGPQGFNPATAGTTVSPISNGTYTISGLAAQTTYDVYVYAICGSGDADTVRHIFTTPFIPNCKTPNTLAISNLSYNDAVLTWNQPGDQPQFWTVRYAAEDFNPATASANAYTELTINGTTPSAQLTGLVAGTTYYVYVKSTCSTSPVDESPWSQMSNANPAFTFTTQACVAPTDVVASDVTNSTAMISWTEAGVATAWTLVYGPAGFDPETEGTTVAATSASVELTGLDAATVYDVYVKSNCTATDESDWSAAATFLTACPDGGSATIGDGTGTTTGVPVANYGSTYCQQIFTADELREAGVASSIAGLGFNWQAIDASFDKYFSIWMANTDKSEFASTSDFVPFSELTPVYGPAFIEHGTGAGEQEYVFNNAFEWDGTSNIVVVTLMNAGATDNNSSRRAYTHSTGSENRSMFQRKDGAQYTEEQLATIAGQARSTNRANITFIAPCNTDVTCFAPASVTIDSITPSNVVTVKWAARTDLRPVVNNFEMKYGLAGFDPDNSGTLVPNLNNVFNYILTAQFESGADYDVYVRTVCGDGDYSNWTKASFHTYPTCWAPTELAVSATTTNSVTLSWTENTPNAATRWEVAYGEVGFDPNSVTPVETTNNSSFELTGLRHSTTYQFYVRAKCSGTDHSDWSDPVTGTTQCGTWTAEELPLFENFDAYTTGLPFCWLHVGAGNPQVRSSNAYSGSYKLDFRGTTANDIVALPAVNNSSTDPVVLSFYTRPESTNSRCGQFDAGYITDVDDSSTFVAVETYAYNDISAYALKEVVLEGMPANARPAFRHRAGATNYYWYVDDVTVKLLEHTNTLADNGGSVTVCNEYVMPDTANGGNYHGNINATYVIRPAEAGKVAHLTGSYNLENGYDFLSVYRGAANANNLVGRYTGNGTIDYMTASNLWADSGYITLVFTTDADNAFNYTGFKLFVSCDCPQPAADIIPEVAEANGTYTWRNDVTYTNNIVRTGLTYSADAAAAPAADLNQTAQYTYTNVAGCDSVTYGLELTLHPTYSFTYNAEICQRDVFPFYGNDYTATGTYTVALTSQYGADSTGILNLQMHPAPSAGIYYNNRLVSEVADFCDNANMTIMARSDNGSATFAWDDQSTAAERVVNPHESNTYTVIATESTYGCTSLPATLTVTTVPVPELSIEGDAEVCYGQNATLTLTDANNVDANYRWSTGATSATITVKPTQTTTYTVTATTANASACTATAEFTVQVNALPVVTATASVSETCRDSVINLSATNVEGYTYSWSTGATTPDATTVASSSMAYTVTVTDENGCQNEFSTATVAVYPSYEVNDNLMVCYTNNPYRWGDMTITQNGRYDQNFTIGHGCDSLVHLAFNFEEMGVENSNREVCEGTSVTWGEQTIVATESTVLTYVDNSGDCPVQMNLNLVVNHPAATTIENTVCDTYTWPVSGETYTQSGAYPYTLATTKGCDSVVTLNLTVNYQNTGVETVTACDNYVWNLNGVNYSASTNEPTFTLENQWGCDSVVTLNLTVNYRSYHEEYHCVSDSRTFTWDDGQTYNLNVALTDSIEYVTGTNDMGCNEIALLHLVMNPVTDTLNWVDIEACDEYEIQVVNVNDNCEGVVETLFLRESGDYELRTPNAAAGHDQWTRIHLTINTSEYHTTVVEACLPYTWTINREDSNPFEVATVTEAMVNGAPIYNMSVDLAEAGFVASGCSNIEVLRLTPKYPSVETIDAVICQNGFWEAENGNTYYGSNLNLGNNVITWDNTDVNADGCPLTKKVNLTVNPVYSTTAELTFCEGEFTLNEESGNYELTVADQVAGHENEPVVLTIPGALNEEVYNGEVEAMWKTTNGCDSTVVINYTVNPVTTVDETYTVCYKDNFTWDVNGRLYNNAGQYTESEETENPVTGCRQVRNLTLTVLGAFENEETINVCTSYEGPDGQLYHETRTFDVPYEGEYDHELYCDAITHLTYNVLQNTLTEHFVLATAPYTWMNGEVYNANVSGIYYAVPATQGDCEDVHLLNLTITEPVVVCENSLPYSVTYGTSTFVITEDAEDHGFIGNGVDTVIAFTVLRNSASQIAVTECDSYTWANGNGMTYAESGEYSWTTTNEAGCDSVVTLTLTINASSAETVEATVCDSYVWENGNGETYTESGEYSWTTTNADGCAHEVTLQLTVNTNAGDEVSEVACATYTWELSGETYTNNGTEPLTEDHSVAFEDANGCMGNHVLHLTLNPVLNTSEEIVVNDAASYVYNGVMYEAPIDTTFSTTFTTYLGCDSIHTLHLVIPVTDDITEIPVEACGSYTWTIAGVEHTYEWIPRSERLSHGNAMFKDVTFNKYVYTYPSDTTFGPTGAMVSVRVLHLNLLESTTSAETVNVPVSHGSYDIVSTLDGSTVETVSFTYADRGTTRVDTVGVGSVAYCNDFRTFTINIIDNYDTTEVYACSDEATYTWNGETYEIGTPGHTFWFSQVENEGTMDELVHVLKVNQRPVNAATATATACDSYTWTEGDGETYSESGVYVYNYTDDNQCAATKTLNLTVNYSSNVGYAEEACDTYTWSRNNQTYTTSGTYFYNYTNEAGCASTDSIVLTIKNNSNQSFTVAECNSYTWAAEDGGDGQTYTTSGTKTYAYTADNGCPSVNTLNLTINLPGSQEFTETACDSYEWNGETYTASGDYTYDYTTAAGCASTDVLHLTVNASTHNAETVAQCDSYEWNGQSYTESGVYTYNYNNELGCPSTDTLHLTINVNNSTVDDTIVACDEYTWAVSNRVYNASGSYTARTQDDNGCFTTNTLELTINSSTSNHIVEYISDGSYRYTYQDGTQQLFSEGVYNVEEHYTNAEGCDSTLTITFNVGTSYLGIDNVINCYQYTWRNGETYVWTSDAERDANLNADGDRPLYKTSEGTYVYYNPTFTVERENDYDSIYMLALTLTQSANSYDEVTMNISESSLVYGDSTFSFSADSALMHEFVNDSREFEVHFPSVRYCDSIVTLTVNLVNNYQEVAEERADICVSQSSYTWRGHTVSTATNDYDHAHTYYIYDDINDEGIIEYIVVNQHPFVYATERRAACDEYTWNGTTYTESTSNATAYFAAGTVLEDGTTLVCDSTVTLILTINHNSNQTFEVPACETYTWAAANGGNDETYTESGTYSFNYDNPANGCPSTNTLVLTINHNSSTEYSVDECDSYTWTAEEGGNGTVYTTSGDYTYNYNTAEGCPSINTLHLTIRNNSNQTYTETACDSYVWTADNGGDGQTYTESGVYTYDFEAENGCPSTNTLNLTINVNSSDEYTVVECDSYEWHGTVYTVSGDYTYDYSDANNCASEDVLHLTINNSVVNVMSAVECNSYTWTRSDQTSVELNASGSYAYTYTGANSCTVTDSLYLTIGTGRAFGREYVTVCGPYTWTINGQTIDTYDESIETSATVVNPATGCDSLVFLYLTVNPQTVTEASICDNATYTWAVNNETYAESGIYDVSETDNDGNCVSNERLVLTVNPTFATNLTAQVCLGQGYEGKGFVIAADELPEAGEYTFTQNLTTTFGCDSIVTLTVTVGDILTNTVEATACDTYIWNAGDGNEYTYTVSGQYSSEPYANADGCTTVDVLTLAINQNAGSEYNEVACDNFMWNGTVYTESGDYTYEYVDGNGCTSTDVLHLTINNGTVNTIETVACDKYEWHGEVYATSGAYRYLYTTEDGCSGVDVLVLTINSSTSAGYTVNACDSYTWNGVEYDESGDYLYSYETEAGCVSTDTLHLTVNKNTNREYTATACDSYNWYNTLYTESGDYSYDYMALNGCPSTDVLHLTVNHSATVTIDTTVCGSFDWNGGNYMSNTTITNHYTAANGCDSTEVINLTVLHHGTNVVMTTACDSYTWDADGLTYTTSGTYMAFMEGGAANGCDSAITLVLTINPSTHNAETVASCEAYTWNGETYSTSGDYTYEYTAENGCASADTLHLTVNTPASSTVSVNNCGTYFWNGNLYDQSGTYTYTTTAANGCDSTVTLHLTVGNAVATTIPVNTCNSYTWNGVVYSQSGNYTETFTGANGCDSVVTLSLTLTPAVQLNLAVAACDSYTWNNSTYTQSGYYSNSFTTQAGCDSVVVLNLTINNSVNTTASANVCGNYFWNGETYTTSGTYMQNFTAANGCDSTVTLTLVVNQPATTSLATQVCGSYTWGNTTYTTSGTYTKTFTAANGCDSVVTMNLLVKQPVNTALQANACDAYTWNNSDYTTSGTYTQTFTAANGCDSVVTLYLTVNNSATTTLAANACNAYLWNGAAYSSTGSYTQTFTTSNGCDSTVTLNLVIKPNVTSTVNEIACGSYTWNDETFTQSGIHTYTYTAANGCDSVVTLNLTIAPAIQIAFNATACGSYTWEGEAYTTSGNYSNTYTALNGCDSVVTLHLTINDSFDTIIPVLACNSFTWEGNIYTHDALLSHTYTAANGCDSTVNIALTVNYSTSNAVTASACGSYTWNDDTYSESGEYQQTFTGLNGCDSVVTLYLTIYSSHFDTINQTACDSYTWIDGETYTESASMTYTTTDIHGCDSVVTMNLVINHSTTGIDEVAECDGFIWIDGNNYTASTNEPTFTLRNAAGCDSVVTLHLTINNSVEQYQTIEILESQLPYMWRGHEINAAGEYEFNGFTVNGCDSTVYLTVSVNQVAIDVVSTLDDVKVYPNPTRGIVNVTAENVVKVEVLDIVGRLVATFDNTNTFDLSNLGEGAYTLRITLPEGITVRKIVKK